MPWTRVMSFQVSSPAARRRMNGCRCYLKHGARPANSPCSFPYVSPRRYRPCLNLPSGCTPSPTSLPVMFSTADIFRWLDGSEFMGERLVVQFARGSTRPRDGFEQQPRMAPRPRRTIHRMTITGLPFETSWQVSYSSLIHYYSIMSTPPWSKCGCIQPLSCRPLPKASTYTFT